MNGQAIPTYDGYPIWQDDVTPSDLQQPWKLWGQQPVDPRVIDLRSAGEAISMQAIENISAIGQSDLTPLSDQELNSYGDDCYIDEFNAAANAKPSLSIESVPIQAYNAMHSMNPTSLNPIHTDTVATYNTGSFSPNEEIQSFTEGLALSKSFFAISESDAINPIEAISGYPFDQHANIQHDAMLPSLVLGEENTHNISFDQAQCYLEDIADFSEPSTSSECLQIPNITTKSHDHKPGGSKVPTSPNSSRFRQTRRRVPKTEDGRRECELCGKIFARTQGVRTHQRRDHNFGNRETYPDHPEYKK